MKPEIEGAEEACKFCKEPERLVCNVLKVLRELNIPYKGKCGRDTETGVILKKNVDLPPIKS